MIPIYTYLTSHRGSLGTDKEEEGKMMYLPPTYIQIALEPYVILSHVE